MGDLLPAARQDSGGIWYCAADPITSLPANATTNHCWIVVPFDHRLLKATFGCSNIDNVGVLKAELMQADDGDAKAGTQVGDDITDATLAAVSDLIKIFDFTINNADKVAPGAARMYFLALTGSNSSDRIETPCLSVLVQPVTRSTL